MQDNNEKLCHAAWHSYGEIATALVETKKLL